MFKTKEREIEIYRKKLAWREELIVLEYFRDSFNKRKTYNIEKVFNQVVNILRNREQNGLFLKFKQKENESGIINEQNDV